MSRQGRRRGLAFLGCPFLAAAALLLLPAGAGAATTVGSTFTPVGFQCQDNNWALQTTSPSNAYVVPSAGVLTSWSHVAASTNQPSDLKLEVGRITSPDHFLIVGISAAKVPTAGTTNTYTDISIPVQAGDILGLHSNGINRNCGSLVSGYMVNYFGTDPSFGDTVNTAFTAGLQLDISATLEADCDVDGLGDETEDVDTSSCNQPPSTIPPPSTASASTGKRAAALKKCKKKFPKGAKRQKCIKKAKRLPV
jgi:hypothetical protein